MNSTNFETMNRDRAKRVARRLNRSLRLASHQRTVMALTEGRYELLSKERWSGSRSAAEDLAVVAHALAYAGPVAHQTVAAACRLKGFTADVIDLGGGPAVCAQNRDSFAIEVCCAPVDGVWTLVEVNAGVHGALTDIVALDDALDGVVDVTCPLDVADGIVDMHDTVRQEVEQQSAGCPECDEPWAYTHGSGEVECLFCGEVWDDEDDFAAAVDA